MWLAGPISAACQESLVFGNNAPTFLDCDNLLRLGEVDIGSLHGEPFPAVKKSELMVTEIHSADAVGILVVELARDPA